MTRSPIIKNYASAFTLLELLVVISIIGLLASTMLSSVQTARNKAIYARAAQDRRTIETALQMYYDNNGAWPLGTGVYPSSNASLWELLGQELQPYVSLPYPYFPSIANVQEYWYVRGSPGSPITVNIYDSSLGGALIGCVDIEDGYFLDLFWSNNQYDLTKNDGGIDPDGVDHAGGIYATRFPCI